MSRVKWPVLRLGAGIALAVFLLSALDWSEIWEAFLAVSLPCLFLLLMLQLATVLTAAVLWQFLFSGLGINCRLAQMLPIHLAATFVDNVTPGAKLGGEGARLYWFKRSTGADYSQVAVLMVIHKLITLIPLLLVGGSGLKWLITTALRSRQLAPGKMVLIPVTIVLALAPVVLSCVPRWRLPMRALGQQVGAALAFIRAGKFKRMLLPALITALLLWVLYALKMLVLAQAVSFSVGPWALAKASFGAYLVGMVPLTPGGLGLYELALTEFLSLLEAAPGQIGVLLLLYRTVTYAIPTVSGGIALLTLWPSGGEGKDGV